MATLIQEHLELGKKFIKLSEMYKSLQDENEKNKNKISELEHIIETLTSKNQKCEHVQDITEETQPEVIEEKPKRVSKKKKEDKDENLVE